MAKEELKVAGMKLKIDGAAQFQSDLSLCAKESSKLKLDLKLLEAQTTSAGKNGVEYLREKSANLTNQITAQQQKTKLLNQALAELKGGAEVDAQQVAKLEREIYKSEVTTAELTRALSNNKEALAKVENQSILTGKRMQEMGEKAKKTGEKMAKAGTTMTTMMTVPIAAAGVVAVKFASDYQESLNKVNVAYKGNAKEVIKWSETTLEKIGLAKGTSLDMAAAYGDMATGMGFATDAASNMGTEMVERAADLASFKNIKIDIANTALTSIFTGETESLKKLGVVMTEANLVSYMQAEGYKKTYQELTQAEKVTLRYRYVMDATNNSAGDFERTIDGTANQSRLFQESLKELAITFGEDLLPVITPIIKGANALIQSFGDLDDTQRKIVIGTALLVAGTGPLLVTVGKGITLYGTLKTALGAHKIALASAAVATKGLAVAEGTATIATKGMATSAIMASAAFLPLTIAIAATAAIAAPFVIASNDLKKAMKTLDNERQDSESKLSASEANVAGAISQVTSALDANTDAQDNNAKATGTTLDAIKSYGDAISESDAKMSEWDGGISKAQERLSELAAQVATESREYTKKEKEEIAALIDTIDLYTKEKAELYQKQMGTLALIIQQESNLTVEQITAYMGELNEFYEKSETYANESYARELVALQEKYGEEGELDTKAFDDGLTIAKNKRDLAIDNAEEERDRVLEVLNDKAVKASEIEMSYFTNVTEADEKANTLRKEKKAAWVEKMLELSNIYSTGLYSDTQYLEKIAKAEAEINATYDQQIIDADSAMADAITQSSSDSIAAKIESYREMAAAGVTIAEEDLAIVNEYLDTIGEARIDIKSEANGVASDVTSAFSGMSANAYQWGKNTIDRYLAGLKSSGSDGGTATQQILSGVARANGIKSYAVGTHYLEKDGLIFAHEGEAIIPKAENPYIKPAISLGSIATNRALSSVTHQSSVVNNTTTNAPVNLSMAGAVFNVRSQQDIDQIASALALKVATSRKAVGV